MTKQIDEIVLVSANDIQALEHLLDVIFAPAPDESLPTVDTLEGLESLGLGAIVRDQDGYTFERTAEGWIKVVSEGGWDDVFEGSLGYLRDSESLIADIQAYPHLGPALDVLSEGEPVEETELRQVSDVEGLRSLLVGSRIRDEDGYELERAIDGWRLVFHPHEVVEEGGEYDHAMTDSGVFDSAPDEVFTVLVDAVGPGAAPEFTYVDTEEGAAALPVGTIVSALGHMEHPVRLIKRRGDFLGLWNLDLVGNLGVEASLLLRYYDRLTVEYIPGE